MGEQLQLVVWREYIILAGLLLFSNKSQKSLPGQIIAEVTAKKLLNLHQERGNSTSASGEVMTWF